MRNLTGASVRRVIIAYVGIGSAVALGYIPFLIFKSGFDWILLAIPFLGAILSLLSLVVGAALFFVAQLVFGLLTSVINALGPEGVLLSWGACLALAAIFFVVINGSLALLAYLTYAPR